jgi:hypothetical protein
MHSAPDGKPVRSSGALAAGSRPLDPRGRMHEIRGFTQRGNHMRTLIGLLVLAAAGTAHAADPLEDMAVAQARAQERTATQVGEPFRGAGPKTDYQILLDAGKCYWFSGTSEGLKKLYMYLWKPGAGAFTPRVADLRSPGQGTMAYCADTSGMHRFQVKTEGAGRFVVAVFAKAAPPPAAVAAPVPVAVGPDLAPLCDQRAAASAPGARRLGAFFEGAGNSYGHDDKFDYPVQLDAGKCYWIVACGEPDHIKKLFMYLWGPDNKRITEIKSDDNRPTIGHCAKETGMFKFQVKIASGSGRFKAAMYGK